MLTIREFSTCVRLLVGISPVKSENTKITRVQMKKSMLKVRILSKDCGELVQIVQEFG